tara:strand:+ start:269 stop:451 length:183 start_codon:yes stop_codon:yes gene_type:complete
MIIRDHELQITHATLKQAFKEGSPVHLGFRQGTRDTQNPVTFIGTNANDGKDGNIPNHAI